jgi:hypothetical protein
MNTKRITVPAKNEAFGDVVRRSERQAFNLDLLQAEAARMVRFATEMRAAGAL